MTCSWHPPAPGLPFPGLVYDLPDRGWSQGLRAVYEAFDVPLDVLAPATALTRKFEEERLRQEFINGLPWSAIERIEFLDFAGTPVKVVVTPIIPEGTIHFMSPSVDEDQRRSSWVYRATELIAMSVSRRHTLTVADVA